jgi:RNA polymerase subunit RPABC4/transcription elongation factor Spt4
MNAETALDHLKENAWVRPSNYVGKDWTGYLVIVSQNRDSGTLEKVNFETARKLLSKWEGEEVNATPPGDIPCQSLQVTVASANHWACGWVESLMIHKDASEDALIEAAEIICSLADYPCLDDMALSNNEYEEAAESWNRYLGDNEKVRLAKLLGIKTPGLAARWTFETVNYKTEGRVLDYMRE